MELDISTADEKLMKQIKKVQRKQMPLVGIEPGPLSANGQIQISYQRHIKNNGKQK